MCGIAGVLTLCQEKNLLPLLAKGNAIQIHRGPDFQGQKVLRQGKWQVGLAHQRLSILDLSFAGEQPMFSPSARSVLIYNGEVYNYKEVQKTLPPYSYKGRSDTEVLAHALEVQGVEKAITAWNGMWAFAFLHQDSHILYLCRDRLGIKPLYYYQRGDELYFASEVKTILAMAEGKFCLDYQVIGEYLLQSLQDTGAHTFFQEIKALLPGHYLAIDLRKEQLQLQPVCYWNISSIPKQVEKDPIQKVQALLQDAVTQRLHSDVPVGVMLSGGIDSSSIAGLMQHVLGAEGRLQAFSAVSPQSAYDESPFIDTVASFLQAKVHKVPLCFSPDVAMELLKKAIWYHDAPVGSFSQVAHYLLMQKAKEQGITVILSGQGADELFCGYKKYIGFYLQFLWREKQVGKALQVLFPFLYKGSILLDFNRKEAARYLPLFWQRKKPSLAGALLQHHYRPVFLGLSDKQTVVERQIADVSLYSIPFLTHAEDRMSMAFSREIRLPFLDYRLVELALHLPMEMKLYKGWTKYALRKAMQPFVPPAIAWRKDKQGFINPQEAWIKKEWVSSILEYFQKDALIFQLGLVKREVLLALYQDYRQGGRKYAPWYRDILNPLSLEIWLQLHQRSF